MSKLRIMFITEPHRVLKGIEGLAPVLFDRAIATRHVDIALHWPHLCSFSVVVCLSVVAIIAFFNMVFT